MKYYFKDISKPSAVILGCTHFPLISQEMETYFANKPLMIHSGEAIVEYLQEHYQITPKGTQSDLKIFASDNVEGLRKIAREWLGTDTYDL